MEKRSDELEKINDTDDTGSVISSNSCLVSAGARKAFCSPDGSVSVLNAPARAACMAEAVFSLPAHVFALPTGNLPVSCRYVALSPVGEGRKAVFDDVKASTRRLHDLRSGNVHQQASPSRQSQFAAHSNPLPQIAATGRGSCDRPQSHGQCNRAGRSCAQTPASPGALRPHPPMSGPYSLA